MAEKREFLEGVEKPIKILGLFVVLGFALFIRLEDLRYWQKHRDYCYYKNEPLLTTLDAYYYLRLARDIVQGDYKAKDEKRSVPDYMARPKLPPLLSMVAAYLSRPLYVSPDKIALFLPPLLGCLVIIPYFLWGRVFGGYLVGFVGSLLGLTSCVYYHRTKIGWFDTDILNVFFMFLIPYFLLLYCQKRDKKRYFYLFLSLVLSLLFIWWWYPARFLVGFLILMPLFLSLFFYRETRIETAIKISIIVIMIGIVLFKYRIMFLSEIQQIMIFLSRKQVQGDFPSVAASVSELKRVPVLKIMEQTSGHLLIFILGLLGWLALMLKKYKQTLFLYVPLTMGIFGFLYSQRFVIFFIPFLTLGFGYVFYLLFEKIKNYHPIFYSIPVVLIIVAIFINLKRDLNSVFLPKIPAQVIAGLDYINQATPKDASIWCWWDLGYTAQYWANRGTFIDGGGQSPKRTYFAALPLAASNWYLSVNIIKFFSQHGEGGFNGLALKFGHKKAIDILKTALSAPPDEQKKVLKEMKLEPDKWEAFFFPKKTRNIYLVLDGTLPGKAYWWYYFGSWDPKTKTGIHPAISPVKNCEINNYQITSPSGLRIQLNTGLASYRGKPLILKELVIYDTKTEQVYKRQSFRENGLIFELILPLRIGYIVSEDFYKSTFNKLFILNSYHKKLFAPVFNEYLFIQVWEVL